MKSMNAPQKTIKRRAYLRQSREIDEAEIYEVEQTLKKRSFGSVSTSATYPKCGLPQNSPMHWPG